MKHKAVAFACSMGFWDTADPMLSRDRKWPRVTKCRHSRVVGHRLEGSLAVSLVCNTSAINWLERLVSDSTYYVPSGTSPILIHSFRPTRQACTMLQRRTTYE